VLLKLTAGMDTPLSSLVNLYEQVDAPSG